ncbi:MAG TPA: RagB/SusD family nutrient uptake outer membrane protein [Gemmatimonas sp.]|nr:RagB/SusD family nutrient uptake outer membrane protein [Gemmatimonas sp.]
MRFRFLSGGHRATAARLAAAGALLSGAGGCSWADTIEVVDPDVINPQALASPAAATTLRNGVVLRLAQATSGGENVFLLGGLLADEWRSGDTFEQRNTTDQRTLIPENSFLAGAFRAPMRVYVESQTAIAVTRQYQPTPRANIGLMFALGGYAANLIGEHFCNGIPYSTIVDGKVVDGAPEPFDNSFIRAIAFADSALREVSGPAADSARVTHLASVVRGRALLNRGQFAAAAAAVTGVPTSFIYQAFHSANSTTNQNWGLNSNSRRYVISDVEGGNGLPFRTANDPRIRTAAGTGTRRLAFDTETPFFETTNFAQFGPVTLLSGIEARLIEAEAALRAGNPTQMLSTLNALRTQAVGGVAGLAPLTDPGTENGRVDLVMRERAFWMFGTGHRLGDLRRLVRQYNRPIESVYPTGIFHKGGGTYGTMAVLPISFDERNNSNFTGCTDLRP